MAEPEPEGLVYDGDLLAFVISNACPRWMSDTAVRELADRIVADLARVPGVTVLRGPDSKPWTPPARSRERARNPDSLVANVIASARLDGRVIDEEWRKILYKIAIGEITAEEGAAIETERVKQKTERLCGKLVRDRIPDIIRQDGHVPIIETASPEDYPHYLHVKLQEELDEYLDDGDVWELADLIEVCVAAAEAQGFSQSELMRIVQEKRNARGGFQNRVIWMGNQPANNPEQATDYSATTKDPNQQEVE